MRGLPKSANDSMTVSRNALARPGRRRGHVTVRNVCHWLAPSVVDASSRAASSAATEPWMTMYAMGVNARICASATPGMPKIQLLEMPRMSNVSSPRRPRRKIIENARMKGGVMMGSTLKAPSEALTKRKRVRCPRRAKPSPRSVATVAAITASVRLLGTAPRAKSMRPTTRPARPLASVTRTTRKAGRRRHSVQASPSASPASAK